MATEIRKVLNLSLGESPKNLRELKKEIGELKTAIGNMVISGEKVPGAFDQATKLLAQDMALLRQTQNATKSEVAALDGSYNKLVQTMRELKTEWRATNDEAKRAKLGQEINKINNELKKLDASVGNYGRNVGNYASMWDGLPKAIENAKKAGNDFSAGLQAMTSLLGLATTDSEQMNKALGVMNSSFQILNGSKGILGFIKNTRDQIKSTREAKKAAQEEAAALKAQEKAQEKTTLATKAGTIATKAFKLALMSIGIGLIIEGFNLLAQNIDKVVGWFTKLGEKLKLINPENQKLKKSNEELNATIEKNNKQLEKDVELMQAKGTAQKEILAEQLRVIKMNIEEAKSAQALLKTKIDDLEATGKKPALVRKLREEYKKNQADLEEMEHKQAVIEAQIETDRRESEKKAASDRAAAARKAAEDKLKADNEAAEALKKAREKAEEDYNKAIEKNMTERERLQKEHNETLANLEKDRAQLTLEQYNKAVEAENAYYSKQLSDILSEEYADAYEKATEKFNNKIKGQSLDQAVLKSFKESFGYISYAGEWLDVQRTLDYFQDYYRQVQVLSINELKKFSGEMNEAAKEYLPSGFVDPSIYIPMYEEAYREYLQDSEAFLKKYGEPFTTAVKAMGENYEQFIGTYTEGLFTAMDSYQNRLEQLKDQGRVREALALLDDIRKEFTERTKFISQDAADEWNIQWTKFESNFKGSLASGWSGATSTLVAYTKESFENALAEIEGQLNALKSIENKTVADLDRIGALEIDRKNLLYQREAAILEASTRKYQQYSTAVQGLLGNVASAWENTIRASIDSLNRQLQEQVKAGKITQSEADKQMAAANDRAEKSFETMKTLQYGVAVISTASAVIQALADPTVPSYVLKAVNAAAALAAGVAQAAQISATHYGSSGSNSTSTPQLIDRTPVQQTVSLNAAEAGQGVAQSMRVYVVESDITEAQNRSRARVSESTF